LHRLGLEYHKPNAIPSKLDEDKQKEFIEDYDKILNSLGNDEVVLFADAVHPTHAARPKAGETVAVAAASGAVGSVVPNRCRRLAKNWENLNRNALAFPKLASIRFMLRLQSLMNSPDGHSTGPARPL
jgi:hypothetical protein